MKKKVSIELFENGNKCSIYTYKINDSKLEFEKFIDDNIDSNEKDFEIVNDLLDRILKNGAQERYFRPEGRINDYLCAIPQKGFGCKLRLFCLRVSEKIIIVGNGGIKTTSTYQEDLHLNSIAEEMQKISMRLSYYKNKGSLIIYEDEFVQIPDILI